MKVNHGSLGLITLNGSTIEYVDRIKYLGVLIKSAPTLVFSAENDLRSFYRASNSILNVLHRPDENALMFLLYANCVPTLTYACSVKEFSSREMSNCNVALNDAIRKIFSFNRRENVRHLREGFGYKSLYEIFQSARRKFLSSHPSHTNAVITGLSSFLP